MPTLMDSLTQLQGQTAAGTASGQSASAMAGTGTGSSTSKLGQLLSAKAGAAPASSTQENLLESATGAQTKQQAQLGAAQTTADVQAQRTAYGAQQTQISQATQQEVQASEQQKQQFGEQAAATMAQLAAGEDQLALQKNQQQAEVLGFQMRLSNDKYVTQLNTVATEQRLDQGANFDEALYNSVLGDQVQVLKQKLGSDFVLAADYNTYVASMSKLEMQDWLAMAQYQAKSKAAAAVASGVGTAGGALAGQMNYGGSTAQAAPAADNQAPMQSAQNPEGYGTTPTSVDSSGNVNPGYQSPSSGLVDTEETPNKPAPVTGVS